MKWLYITLGILAFLYIGRGIEYLVVGYGSEGVVQVVKAGAQP